MGWVGAELDPEPRTAHTGSPRQLAQQAASHGEIPTQAPSPSPASFPAARSRQTPAISGLQQLCQHRVSGSQSKRQLESVKGPCLSL